MGFTAAAVGTFVGATAALGAVGGMIVGGAIVGAAVGGIAAAVTGGDILKGVLIGGVAGGAIGGIGGALGLGGAGATTGGVSTGAMGAGSPALGGLGEAASLGLMGGEAGVVEGLGVAVPLTETGLGSAAIPSAAATAGQGLSNGMMAKAGIDAVKGFAIEQNKEEAALADAERRRADRAVNYSDSSPVAPIITKKDIPNMTESGTQAMSYRVFQPTLDIPTPAVLPTVTA